MSSQGPNERNGRWPGNAAAGHLFRTIRFKPRDLWWGEWVAALLGAGSGGWLGATRAPQAKEVIAIAAALVGVVIGAVVAAMAIQTAGFDRSFLQDLYRINETPVAYLSPFLTTAVIGVLSLLMLLGWGAVPDDTHHLVLGLLGIVSGGLTLWALVSLIPALGSLIQFIELLQISAGTPGKPESHEPQ